MFFFAFAFVSRSTHDLPIPEDEKKNRNQKKRLLEKKTMSEDLFVDGMGGDIPLPFDDDAILVHWNCKNDYDVADDVAAHEENVDNGAATATHENEEEEEEEIVEVLMEGIAVTPERRRVLDWLAAARGEFDRTGKFPRPSWFDDDGEMRTYLDLFYPQSSTFIPSWATHLKPRQQERLVNCIRILQTCDERQMAAVRWDHKVLRNMFVDVLAKPDEWDAATLERVRLVLRQYDVLAGLNAVSAEMLLRYHATDMGAELEKCWLFVGQREHIYWLTMRRWAATINQYDLGSPAARLFREWHVAGRRKPVPPIIAGGKKVRLAARDFLWLARRTGSAVLGTTTK